MRIEQAIYGCQDVGGYRFLARSAGFVEGWLATAERICTGFGERPAAVACPLAVFAQPLDSRHVAVVQAADQGHDDAGRPGALAFRLLIVPRKLYADLDGDLFLIAEALPPPWQARGEVPALEWTAGPPPARTVADVRRILDVEKDRTALLLGASQVLVDGGRVVLRRAAPDPGMARALWNLLPASTRLECWPTSFAFGNKHHFHLAIVPESAADDFAHYVPEAAAGDYPEGRYESALHHAAETDDQGELDALFSRQSRRQRFKLALLLLGLFALVPVFLNLPLGKGEPEVQPDRVQTQPEKEKPEPARAEGIPAEPALQTERETREFRDLINRLFRDMHVTGQETSLREEDLVKLLVTLDREIDARLGERKPLRDPGDLAAKQNPRAILRALLWKHGVADYAEPRLNTAELVERLENKLIADKLIRR